MKQPLISVIVPVYKVEPYLRQCVDSIRNQTYQNLEILLVDDGSPDRCPKICDEYAEKDARIKVIHKENGGLSSARNCGLDHATGEYIGFVDSDDSIAADMYEKMLEALLAAGAEMCICNYREVSEEEEPKELGISTLPKGIYTRSEAFSLFAEYRDACIAWNKLYAASVLEELRFPVGRIHEDEFLAHHAFDRCERVVIVEEAYYDYLRRGGSITGVTYSVKRLDVVLAFFDRYRFFLQKGRKDFAATAQRYCESAFIVGLKRLPYQGNEAVFDTIFKEVVPSLKISARKIYITLLYYSKKIGKK